MSNRATEDRPGASNIAVYLTNSRQWKLNVEATPESRNKPERSKIADHKRVLGKALVTIDNSPREAEGNPIEASPTTGIHR